MPDTKPLTGYPSVDKPWMKYYAEGAWERATRDSGDKTVWDVIEERLKQYRDIPAIEYFGRTISRDAFIDSVYLWARAFKGMGVREDEVVPVYGPFFPAICSMTFALNIIGATPYFLKLAISPEALEEETQDARFAVVFDDMWGNVKSAFQQERFHKVIVVSATDDMPPVKKALLSLAKKTKGGDLPPRGGKYLTGRQALAYAEGVTGEVKARFVPNRSAFITSSSGTTVGGVVKGVVATNEAAITVILSEIASEMPVSVGDRALNNLPPTASTSILSLFLMPLFCGATIVIDPRVSESDYYNQLVKLKPNVIVTTGSMWEAFFNRILNEKKRGKTHSFSYATYWIVGGEGSDVRKIKMWDELISGTRQNSLFSGYGQSELFSTVSVESEKARYNFSGSIMSVGIPISGITVGVFDESGNELPYNQRGELWIKSKSAFKGYYNKPELTAKTLIDGWVHTGDMASIDENGFLYIYGRLSDRMTTASGEKLYLFDVAEAVKEIAAVDDAMALPVAGDYARNELTVHLTWAEDLSRQAKDDALREIDAKLRALLPPDIKLRGFAEHDGLLPYSPTTLKKDRNKMSRQTTGYKAVRDGKIAEIEIK